MIARHELEPCYSCPRGCRIWHDVTPNDGYETVVCQCPEKKNGRCNCADALEGHQIADRIKGAC